ncbi:anhydro-N-acetylmuramic acid kinase, partial [bacterium]|nr:anhydro-N-acetylmuramic acid kinase [bacterium]
AYRRFVLKNSKIKLAIFSGGGTKNKFMMELIRQELDTIEIKLSDEFGMPAAAREAMSFAILGNETLDGRPSNIPSATGASKEVILGSITKAG